MLVFRLEHFRRRRNNLQRAKDCSATIDKVTAWIAVSPHGDHQRRRKLGSVFLLLRWLTATFRLVFGGSGHCWLCGGLIGLLVMLSLLGILLVAIGCSRGADSTKKSAPLSLPCSYIAILGGPFLPITAVEGARTLRLAWSDDCPRSGFAACRFPALQLPTRDAWPLCQSASSCLFCHWHGC